MNKGFIAGNCKPNQKVHTRVGECAMFEGTPKGWIIHDKNESFSLDELPFNTEIKEGIIARGRKRLTPLLEGVTDYQPSGGDVKTSEEGFGAPTPIGINSKSVIYVINEGGLCLFKQLKKLDEKQVRILLVDKNNVVYGTVATIDGKDVFRGFLATLYSTRRDNTGSQTGAILFSVYYDANYENEERNMAAMSLTENIEGLTGVVLKRIAPGKAKLVIACSGDDLTDTYGADIAVPTLYVDEAGENPTSVTYSSATSDLTFIPAEAKYKLVDAKALSEASIEGIEGEDGYTDLK